MSTTNKTASLSVTFTLPSSASGPPYNVTGCAGTITFTDGSSSPFKGWALEEMPAPQDGGAAFTVNVTDADRSDSNQTSIGNWALTFIPRAPSTGASPFGSGKNLITGNGPTSPGSGSTFTLNTTKYRIKRTGTWDWSLIIQMNLPDGTTKCFASDPEMEVES
jgi:hypothetical protein